LNAYDVVKALPTVNAILNSISIFLLISGIAQIKRGNRNAHKKTMLAAFGVSIAFLVCYVTYHIGLDYFTGSSSRKFTGAGFIRKVYFTILISHIILAAIVPILASVTIYLGLKKKWEKHRIIARITFPIWLYVSVTGVVIYLMLYHYPFATIS
jgi:protein SCO1